ncbi:EfeM/EfeO family lipoprotein [Paenibacillus thalictri]|uniref:EfeM/EfeO family lipoprotein n=1 Tax=Paenibacillus thalictri TaxID=2527873 RepID=A0A4Q9DUI5_9BACL|nr:EfeM/EfeO family lipoprotein [Paenibacillus thalictri]
MSSVIISGSLLLAAGCSSNQNAAAPAKPAAAQDSKPAATQETKPAVQDSKPATQETKPAVQETKPAASANPLKDATENYRKFVIAQTDLFVKATGDFVGAIKAGDLDKSKQLYATTRMFYERIEPIAEALGDLDPNIDGREDDIDEKDWRGFHRLEKTLWQDKTTKDLGSIADQLLSDSKLLRGKVETVEITPEMMVTGAVELLNEVSTSKVTGEEDRYSHTDLYDFAANVEGAQKIYEVLKPELQKKDAALSKKIEDKLSELNKELGQFKKGEGYALYDELSKEQVKKLSQAIDALAEPLSNMGKVLEV